MGAHTNTLTLFDNGIECAKHRKAFICPSMAVTARFGPIFCQTNINLSMTTTIMIKRPNKCRRQAHFMLAPRIEGEKNEKATEGGRKRKRKKWMA